MQAPGNYSNEAHSSLIKAFFPHVAWNTAFGKKRGTAVLEEGFDVKPLQMSNEESQFLETRKYQRTVIAGAFTAPVAVTLLLAADVALDTCADVSYLWDEAKKNVVT